MRNPKTVLKNGIKPLIREDVAAILRSVAVEGQFLDRWWDKQERDVVEGLERGLRQGIQNGDTQAQLIDRVSKSLDVAARVADTLTRTAVTTIEANTSAKTFEDGGIAEGYSLDVTFDHRTSPICRKWDPSKVYKFDDPKAPRPPFHFNCRTKIVPVIDWKAMGLEPLEPIEKKTVGAKKETGPRIRDTVDADTSYEDWLKTQPKRFQEEVLGKKRAEWFRDGKVNLAQLVKSDGRQIPIDELRKKLRLK